MPTFGESGAGTQTNFFLEATTFGSQAVLPENGILTKITVRVVAISADVLGVSGLVYADSSGLPGARLAQTSTRVLTTADTGLQDLSFSSPYSLAAGTYWLCIASSGGGQFDCRGYSESDLSKLKSSNAPDPFGTPSSSFEGDSVIYATYDLPSLRFDYSKFPKAMLRR